MSTRWRNLLGLVCGCAAQAAGAGTPPPDLPVDHQLDFWLGEWVVTDYKTDAPEGRNRIESVLKGAALIEHWTETDGREGKSWFYYSHPEKRWKQVWVTDSGYLKEKAQVPAPSAEAVQFEGMVPRRDGGTALDRTTLWRLPDGTVRQTIAWSKDGGQSWETVFDARYRHPGR